VREPLHAIIAGRAEARIRAGEWAPGDRLPPERELCRDLGVSRATLRQALGELEQRGLVTRHQGRGTFAAPPRPQAEPALDREAARPAGRLRDRVILVTGSTGIAAAGARRFAAHAAFAAADLSDESQVDKAVKGAIARFGRLDGLFAVAGGSGRRFGDGPLHDVTLDGWRQTLDLNLTSQFLVARAVLRRMLGQDPTAAGTRGALLLVGSVLARHPVPELFATHAYAAAKGATEALVTATAAFYAPQAIRVNALTPGLVATAMSARAAEDPVTAAFATRKQPLAGGFLDPGEVAHAAVYLLSDESRHVTGQVLAVDGGWSVTGAALGVDAAEPAPG
jgi:NAD(P)-dependent dehydrogenase (short-subunit alcohol dehydrogenase family)